MIVRHKHSGNLFLLVEPDLEFGSFSQYSCESGKLSHCLWLIFSLHSPKLECGHVHVKCLYILLLLFWYSLCIYFFFFSLFFFISGCCKNHQWISRYDSLLSESVCVLVTVCVFGCWGGVLVFIQYPFCWIVCIPALG